MPNTITCTVVPCGGMVVIDLTSTDMGTWTLTRAPTNDLANAYLLYRGPALMLPDASPMWLDLGDGLNSPLDQTTNYTYTFTTSSASVNQAVTPASALEIVYDDYLRLLTNMLQAGVQSVSLSGPQTSWKKPAVFISMPLTGEPTIPAISINQDLIQQVDVPIGHGMNLDSQNNLYQVQEIVNRRYSVTVMVSSVDERTFWELVVISLFKSILIPVLNKMGQDISSSFQSASSQMTERAPGFYFCQIMLEFSGILPVRITTSYPQVNSFEIIVNGETISSAVAPFLYNDGGVLGLTSSLGWPTSAIGLNPGQLWSNGGIVSIVPGATPDPTALPVFFTGLVASTLLAMGGGDLPTVQPEMGSGQIWNNGDEAWVA